MEKTKKEPLIHISRRLNITKRKALIIRVSIFVAAFLICAIGCSIFKSGSFFKYFENLFNSLIAVKSKKPFRSTVNTLEETALLLGISLALLPVFKMKYWNLGAEGQVIIGGLAAATVSKFISSDTSKVIVILLMAISAVVAGALWSLIPAIFKAYFKTNETLFTLMMNYIAMGVISCFTRMWNPEHGTLIGLKNGIFNNVGGYSYVYNIIIITILTFVVYFYMKKTKQGYEIAVVGGSENTARYTGINVKKVIIRTVMISGALCGLVGWLIVAGADHGISGNSCGGRGFTGVLIVWLGHYNPFYMAFIAFVVAFLSRGSSSFASEYLNGNSSFPKISIALFFFVILAGEFFLNYEIHFAKKLNFLRKKEEK